jgi:hypothetical protein
MKRTVLTLVASLWIVAAAVGYLVVRSRSETHRSICGDLFQIADDVNAGRIDNVESARRVAALDTKDKDVAVSDAAVDARARAKHYLEFDTDRPESVSKDLADAVLRLRTACLVQQSSAVDNALANVGSALVADPCVVGTWRATSTITRAGQTDFEGGAGTMVTISNDGQFVEDFSQSEQWRAIDGTGVQLTKHGTETSQVAIGGGQLAWIKDDVGSVFATETVEGSVLVITPPTRAGGRPYTCDMSTLVVTNDAGLGADRYERVP